MKKMVMLSALCLLTVIAKAQTITAESVMKTFNDAAESQNSEYAYNADIEDGLLIAQYVYRKVTTGRGRHADVELHPHIMHRYTYDAQQRLVSRTTLWWNEARNQWQNSYRLDYTYGPGRNTVECCRWKSSARRFADADEKLVYELQPDASVGLVSSYHRRNARADYELTAQVAIPVALFFGDELLTQQPR